jgi:hypothetical protein
VYNEHINYIFHKEENEMKETNVVADVETKNVTENGTEIVVEKKQNIIQRHPKIAMAVGVSAAVLSAIGITAVVCKKRGSKNENFDDSNAEPLLYDEVAFDVDAPVANEVTNTTVTTNETV